MKDILQKDVLYLKLGNKITDKLIESEINNIYKLCNYSRMDLMELGLTNDEINKIIISLQLLGLDLRKNHAKRNTLLDL